MLLGDFDDKMGRKNIFRPSIGKESLPKISNDNGVRVINFVTSKIEMSKVPCTHIYKLSWTLPDGKTSNQIDHILLDRRRH
jgi:hypothetical protein